MPKQSFTKLLRGYQEFREKYALGDNAIMRQLADEGQQPEFMVVSCCDSRVDPGVILQCDPGNLFIVRNVANIIPPFEKDGSYHGTSAALEFGICYLPIKHLIILGHSQCGGINALLQNDQIAKNDFISNWVSILRKPQGSSWDTNNCAKQAMLQSYQHCFTFPWIKERVEKGSLAIHIWYFDIKAGKLFTYNHEHGNYHEFGKEKDLFNP